MGQDEIHFQTEPEKTPRDPVRPSCIELAVLRQELRGHGGHGQQAGWASQSRERRADGLLHCRQADYRGVHKERLPHAGRLGQPLRHERCHRERQHRRMGFAVLKGRDGRR